MRYRNKLLLALLVVPALSLPVAMSGAAAAKDPRPFVNGTTTVAAYDYDNAIRERVEVQAPTDGDVNGTPDRVTIDIIRPGEAAASGIDVPVILEASPYRKDEPATNFDADGIRQVYGGWLDNYFVPRGYAVVFADLPGTFRSTGCDDVGAELEIQGTKAIIDWLNQRTPGFNPDGTAATADWSNGKTGMIGLSWVGTIAKAVAATGVQGLQTIVPMGAISSWYDYTRGHGTPFFAGHIKHLHNVVSNDRSPRCVEMADELGLASDDQTGSYGPWWNPRNYIPNVNRQRASVFLVHGLNDENVRTRHIGKWWQELARNKVPRKIFLHQDAHEDGFLFRKFWIDRLHPWFDYSLQELRNGVMAAPMAVIQREDGSFVEECAWPAAGTKPTRLQLPGKAAVSVIGGSTFSIDDSAIDPTVTKLTRAVFLSKPLPRASRISGTASLTVRVKVDRSASGIGARLVDYGTATRYKAMKNLTTTTCWGDGSPEDAQCYVDTKVTTARSDLNVVTRTIADIGHYRTITAKDTLRPGTWYQLTFELNTDDVVFDAGHRIGLVLTGEPDNPTKPSTGATLTVDPRQSSLTLPLSGATPQLIAPGQLASERRLPGTRKAQPEPEKDMRKLILQSIQRSLSR